MGRCGRPRGLRATEHPQPKTVAAHGRRRETIGRPPESSALVPFLSIVRAGALCVVVLAAGCARDGQRTAAAGNDRYVAVYEQLHPAVVLLTMKIPADDPKRKGQWDDAYGSGVVVESGSWGTRILTDAHVVEGPEANVATIADGAPR